MSLHDDFHLALYGLPASDTFKPDRALLLQGLDSLIEQIAIADQDMIPYETVTIMNADNDQPDGTQGRVYDDPTPANNGVYLSIGGVWSLDTAYYDQLASVVQPLVDAAEAAAAEATAAAAGITDLPLLAPDRSRQVSVTHNLPSNGAVYDATNKGLDIPIGQTGRLGFVAYGIEVADEIRHSGEYLHVVLVLECSTNFLTENTGSGAQMQAFLGSSLENSIGVNMSLTQSAADRITIEGDYPIHGTLIEEMRVYLQIGALNPTSANERHFSLDSFRYYHSSMTRNESALVQYAADNRISTGNLLNKNDGTSGVATNGATVESDGYGLAIPNGSTGNNSSRAILVDFSSLNTFYNGVVTVDMIIQVSTNFDPRGISGGVNMSYSAGGPVNNAQGANLRLKQLSATVWNVQFDYRIVGLETTAFIFYQIINSVSGFSGAGYARFIDVRMSCAQSGGRSGGRVRSGSLADAIMHWREREYDAEIKAYVEARTIQNIRGIYSRTITVGPDGSKQYTTLTAALAANGGGIDDNRRFAYYCEPADYTDIDIVIPSYVDIICNGPPHSAHWKGELADSVSPASIPNHQTFWFNNTSRLIGIKVTCRNMRYPVHSDSGASAIRAMQETIDCHFEHYGNDGARAYQTSIGADPGAVWGAEHAWGMGSHSGQIQHHKNPVFISNRTAFYCHNNADFAEPCYIHIDGGVCKTNYETSGSSVVLDTAASGRNCKIRLDGVRLDGAVSQRGFRDLATGIATNWANMCENFAIELNACRPVPIIATNMSVEVLELRSIDASGSKVRLSGSAMVPLFGASPIYKDGSVGLPGSVFSMYATEDDPGAPTGVTLAERLGDCTSVNKTLNIVFDAGTADTVTLSANYTGMTNAAIVTALNTALADGTRGFYLNSTYFEQTPCASQPLYEAAGLNADTSAILKGMAAAISNNDPSTIRRMISTDVIGDFAGIALENIPVGVSGKLLKPGGIITQAGLSFATGPTVATGDVFGPTAGNAGKLTEGSGASVVKCIGLRAGVYAFRLLS